MCPPGVNGVGNGQAPAQQQPVENVVNQAAEAQKAQGANPADDLPPLLKIGKTQRILMGIFSFGLSEVIINDCKAMNADKLHLLNPDVKQPDKAKVERANSKLQNALLGVRDMPFKFNSAKKAALASVRSRFGKNAVPQEGYAEAESRAGKKLLDLIEKSDHVITKKEARSIFEAEYAQAHVEKLAKDLCREKLQERELPIDGKIVNDDMALHIIRSSSDMAQKIADVTSPEQVADLLGEIESDVEVELSKRVAFETAFKAAKQEAVSTLVNEGGLSEEAAAEFVNQLQSSIKEASDAEPQGEHLLTELAVARDAKTGALTNAQTVINSMKESVQQVVNDRVAVLKELNKLDLPDGPQKVEMQKAALGQVGLVKPEVVKVVSETVQKVKLDDLKTALATQSQDAVVASLGEVLAKVNEAVIAGLADAKTGNLGDEGMSVIDVLAAEALVKSHPELKPLIATQADAFAAAAYRLTKDEADSATAHLAQAMLQSATLPELKAPLEKLQESERLLQALQCEELPDELCSAVRKRQQQKLCRKFGPEGFNKNFQETEAWKATTAELQSRVKEGRLISLDDVLDVYEVHAVREMMLPKVQKLADEVARDLAALEAAREREFEGDQGNEPAQGGAPERAPENEAAVPINVKGFLSSGVIEEKLKALENRTQLPAVLDQLKELLKEEVKFQRELAATKDETQNSAILALKGYLSNLPDEQVQQHVDKVVQKLHQQLEAEAKALIENSERNPENGQQIVKADVSRLSTACADIVRPKALKAIAESNLPADVKQIMQEVVLQGEVFANDVDVKAFKAAVKALKKSADEAMKSLAQPEKCFEALRDALTTEIAKLKSSVSGEIKGESERLLISALIGSVLDGDNPIAQKMNADVESSARLLLLVSEQVNQGSPNADQAMMDRIVLAFVQKAASDAVVAHVQEKVTTSQLVEQVNLATPSDSLKNAIQAQLMVIRAQLGNEVVSQNWHITRSDVWSRLKNSVKKRLEQPDVTLTALDIADEYAKQARIVLFEKAMTRRIEAYVERRQREQAGFKVFGSVSDLVQVVTAHLQHLDLTVPVPDRFTILLNDFQALFEQEAEDQNAVRQRIQMAKDAVIGIFQDASGMDRDAVVAELNLNQFDEAVLQICGSVKRTGRLVNGAVVGDVQGGNLSQEALEEVLTKINELGINFGEECLKFVDAVKEARDVDDNVKSFLMKTAMRQMTFKDAELLAHLKTAMQVVDAGKVDELKAIVTGGGDNAGKAFVDKLAEILAPLEAKFSEAAGDKADEAGLLLANHCLATMFLMTNPALQEAMNQHSDVIVLAQLALSANEEFKAPEKAGVVKICERFFNLEPVKSLTKNDYGFEIVNH